MPFFVQLAHHFLPETILAVGVMVLILIFLFLNAGLAPDVDYLSLMARDLERPALAEFFSMEEPG